MDISCSHCQHLPSKLREACHPLRPTRRRICCSSGAVALVLDMVVVPVLSIYSGLHSFPTHPHSPRPPPPAPAATHPEMAAGVQSWHNRHALSPRGELQIDPCVTPTCGSGPDVTGTPGVLHPASTHGRSPAWPTGSSNQVYASMINSRSEEKKCSGDQELI